MGEIWGIYGKENNSETKAPPENPGGASSISIKIF